MTYFAAMLVRSGGAWRADEVDLLELADSDALVDLLREAGKSACPAALFMEREDEWFGVVRLDDDELKIFVSDVYAAAHSDLGEMLVPTGDEANDDDEEEDAEEDGDGASVLIAIPGGDTDLLNDLGVSEDELLELCAEEGMLPGDALSALAERIGAGEAFDGLR